MSEWQYKSALDPEQSQLKLKTLSQALGMSEVATQVCINRGMNTVEQIQNFLNPKLDGLTHPFKILDLEKAAEYILAAQTADAGSVKKIRVFTDYDVDGTTGAALLTWFFRDLGFSFDVTQPDRFKDGYGLNVAAIEQAAKDGVDTFITVDCGITNFEAAERARDLKINLMIVDHHQLDPIKGMPHAFAVINPQRADDESGLKQLCGCALAFYLSMGIRIKAREKGWFAQKNIPEPNLKELLDLVVIATAADMVPLTGDNRILVKQGLDILRQTKKPGLRAMIERAGIEVKTVSPMSLGFALGPRINASGRMGSAETAYLCLTTKSEEQGKAIANELEGINKSRATLQNQIWDEVRAVTEAGIAKGLFEHAVIVASKDWHEGVVGIVASRVVEHFKKPALVLAIREDGIAKGSARSYGGYNILEALHLTKNFLNGYGGHKFAAGLSLAPEKIIDFTAAYNQAISTLAPERTRGILFLEGNCSIHDLNIKALEEIEKLGPFGPGNPEPLFAVEAWVESQMVLKGRHLKLKLASEANRSPSFKVIEGIWFNAAERLEWSELMEKSAQLKKRFRFAGIPELNRFQGRVTPTLRVKDIES